MLDDFLVRAFVAGIGVALVAGPLGCFIVWRRMAYFGDTMAHSALLGVALGFLVDIHPTLGVVIVTVLIVIAGAAAMPFVIAVETWNMVFMFAFGGMFASLYTFALVLLGERFRGADLASASVAFGVMWGVGSVAGPPIGGATMDLLEPHGLPIVIGAAFALYLPIPIWEYVKKRRRQRS